MFLLSFAKWSLWSGATTPTCFLCDRTCQTLQNPHNKASDTGSDAAITSSAHTSLLGVGSLNPATRTSFKALDMRLSSGHFATYSGSAQTTQTLQLWPSPLLRRRDAFCSAAEPAKVWRVEQEPSSDHLSPRLKRVAELSICSLTSVQTVKCPTAKARVMQARFQRFQTT